MTASQAFDLVVVGGGFAGLVAANRAAQLGLKVAVLERGKEESYPCNSRVAGGVLHISYHNLKDPEAVLVQAIAEITGGSADAALATKLAGTAARAVDWLEQEGAQYSRTSAVSWRQCVLAPPRPPVTHLDWNGWGADATMRQLEKNLAQRGGELHRDTRVISLIMQDGRCVGVNAQQAGAPRAYGARAVMLADGGFQADADLLRQYVASAPEKVKQRCAPTGSGDGLKMARQAGAAVTGLEAFYGHLLSRDAFHNDRVWPYPQIDEVASAGIVVDAQGRRIADEGMGGVFLANAVARLADPACAVAIFDEAIWSGPGRSAGIPVNPNLVAAGGTLHQADTIAALATKVEISPNELEHTVAAYNDAVRSGRAVELSPARKGKKFAPACLATPPYYGIPLCAGITYTMGGIVIDAHARALRPDQTPIPGLYAAGSTTGGLDGGQTCGYVGGLIKAIVFGLLGAEHAAGSASAA